MVRIVEATGHRYSWPELLEAFPPLPRPEPKPTPSAPWQPADGDDERIAEALAAIPADDRVVWVSVGLALEGHYKDRGRDLWERWSQSSSKYDADDLERVWRSFKGTGTTIATLFHHAKQHGWIPPETREKPLWSLAGRAISMFHPDEAWEAFQQLCRTEHPGVSSQRLESIFNTILEKELSR